MKCEVIKVLCCQILGGIVAIISRPSCETVVEVILVKCCKNFFFFFAFCASNELIPIHCCVLG